MFCFAKLNCILLYYIILSILCIDYKFVKLLWQPWNIWTVAGYEKKNMAGGLTMATDQCQSGMVMQPLWVQRKCLPDTTAERFDVTCQVRTSS